MSHDDYPLPALPGEGAARITDDRLVRREDSDQPHQELTALSNFTVATLTPLGRTPSGPATVVVVMPGAVPTFAADRDVLQAMREGRGVVALCVDPHDAAAIGGMVAAARRACLQ